MLEVPMPVLRDRACAAVREQSIWLSSEVGVDTNAVAQLCHESLATTTMLPVIVPVRAQRSEIELNGLACTRDRELHVGRVRPMHHPDALLDDRIADLPD